jgi:cell division protein FtsL
MTVISYRNNHFNTSKVAVRSANLAEEKTKSSSFIQWLNVFIFCIIIFVAVTNVLWSVGENSIRLDIQGKEKQIVQLEEKNSELKNQLSEMNTPVNLEKMASDYGLVRESQPQYFSIKEKVTPLGFNAINNQEN